MIIESQVHGLVPHRPLRGAITMVIRLLKLSCLFPQYLAHFQCSEGRFQSIQHSINLTANTAKWVRGMRKNLDLKKRRNKQICKIVKHKTGQKTPNTHTILEQDQN